MQVPYQLHRRPRGEPATGLLVEADTHRLLELCAQLGFDPLPDIFSTADGFLLLLEAPTEKHWPNTIRLCRLAEFLLLPADADLSPQLHPEEAAGLTRDRGLVFLPGGRVLAFEPASPLEIGSLLSVGPIQRGDWSPLPMPRQFPEQLRITYAVPYDDPEDVVAAGGQDIGTETPRPDPTGTLETAANRARMSFGNFLAGLGRLFGIGRLREAGERMAQRAAEAAPRLGVRLYGEQGAALRDLLRLFKSGDLDKALRRAIPKADGPAHRGRAPAGSNLPTHDLRYSLGNLLGGRSGGPANIWSGHDEVVAELYREYRKAAEDAANKGDFRRAAFIYGKLLAEWRSAADVLARGGLHHDAAILYRDKLADPLRAATAFEAAGEFDEALRIYEQRTEYERAGDLLRRMGEEERAIDKFIQAAEVMMQTGRGPLRAGEFVLKKTSRGDLAETYFAAGWDLRNVSTRLGDALPCALELARLLANREKPDRFLQLLDEGESYFESPGNAPGAGQFFNEFARLSAKPLFDEHREEIRDRCLLALAGKIREHARAEDRPGTIVSTLLGTSGIWDGPTVRDASFALRSSLKQPREVERSELPITILHLASGTITAARVAPNTGEVFAGFDNGLVMGFRPSENRPFRVGQCPGSIGALATSLDGAMIVASYTDQGGAAACSFTSAANRDYAPTGLLDLMGNRLTGLAPLIVLHRGEWLTLIRHGPEPEDLSVFRGSDLLRGFAPNANELGSWPLDLPLPKEVPGFPGVSLLSLQQGEVRLVSVDTAKPPLVKVGLGWVVNWTPHLPAGSTLTKPPASWHQHTPDRVEVVGLNDENALYWLDLRLHGTAIRPVKVLATGCREGYRAVKLIRPGSVVGVTNQNRLIWLRVKGDKLEEWSPPVRLTNLSPAVAAFYSMPTLELIVLLANGYLVRVPVPA